MLYFWLRTFIHLHITITLAWPIMEDIEPIDLGSGDRPREFETVTHFTFRLEQYHIHIHTLTLWTCRPTHFELDMTPPLGTITRLYYPYSPLYTTVPLLIISIISWIWPGSVWDGLTRGELCTMIDGLWWESVLTTWRYCWDRGGIVEHPNLSHCAWLQRVGMIRDGDFMRR